MYKLNKKLTLTAGCAFLAMQTHAEVPVVEETIVWGTEIKSNTAGLNNEALAIKQADHVSDLLRTIPGVDVGGAHSLNQRISIRSLDDKDLKITIDGANQNTYMYHHMGNLQIHADILESVDLEIGTNSVINGGLGGAVRFETKTARQLLRSDNQYGARIETSYGNNANQNVAVSGYGMLNESMDALLYYNRVNRDNYEVGGGEIKNETGSVLENTDGTVRGLEGEVQDMLFKYGWDFTEGHRFEMGMESYSDEGDYSYRPDMGLATDLAIADSMDIPLLWPTEFTRNTITLNYDAYVGPTLIKTTFFENESNLKRDETGFQFSTALIRGRPVSASAAQIEGQADNSGINVLAESEFTNQVLTYGLDYINYETKYEAAYLSGTVDASEEDVTNTSFFIQDRIELNHSFAVIPGVRYDQSDLKSTVVDDSFDQVSGALAAEYNFDNTVLVKLSTTQLFKAPEIGEVFTGAGLYETANPDIEAETGTNNELSLAYQATALGNDSIAFGFTVFQTGIDDYIYDYAAAPAETGARSWKDNVGDMAIDGYETYVDYSLGQLSLLLTFSKAQSELDAFSEYGALDGARIDREQGDTISFNVDYTFPSRSIALHWDVLRVGDVAAGVDLDGAGLDNSKEGFTVHNVSARWLPIQGEGLALTFGIDNLTDEYYASHSSRTGTTGHPVFGNLFLQDHEPGRNVKFTLSYDL